VNRTIRRTGELLVPKSSLFAALLTCAVIGTLSDDAPADPCGMVPPVYLGEGPPIVRVGAQKTYVFYQDGVETFAIRPGYSGKVDEFGMLIPFPTPPALRKLPDHVFEHIAAAIDPPEVVIDLRQLYYLKNAARRAMPASEARDGLKYDEVRVLRQEAVGMYEVAVLEAGSAQALKRWMDTHGFKYPEGMDAACEDYVEAGWCFVAVKTRVGQKKGVEPRPGQRTVTSKLPSGATFDGRVQAMGFRFEVDELVVPMRLSAFNVGDFRNIVYLLTDGPRKIRSIPEEYVVRQLPGEQIFKNVTQPLPLRVIGGDGGEIPEWWRRNLPQRRNPVPHNGAAKDLFAGDLLAVRSGRLSLPHEEEEKVLLRIGERLGLRGAKIDELNAQVLAEQREKTVKAALENVKKMTVTVVDGDFPPEVLGRENLTFAEYAMPSGRNTPEFYDARVMGPAPKKEGVLQVGAVQNASREQMVERSRTAVECRLGLCPDQVGTESQSTGQGGHGGRSHGAALFAKSSNLAWLLPMLSAAMVGLALGWRRKRRWNAVSRVLLVVCLVAVAAAGATVVWGADDGDEQPTIRELINQFSDPAKAEEAIEALVARGEEAIPQLSGEAIEGNDIARRGWAIACLAEIGGEEVDVLLAKVHDDGNQPMLIRTWAAAARIYMTDTTDGLVEKAALAGRFPAVGRPVGMRILERLGAGDEPASAEDILTASIRIPQLQQALAPAILAFGSEKLTGVMATAKDQNARRQAAAYLGALHGQGDKGVPAAVIEVYKFDAKAKDVPWKNGPLFVPGIQWSKEDGRALVGNLIRWHLWCDRKGRTAEQTQIHNNIRSLSLAAAAGYQSPGWQDIGTLQWLTVWGKALGREEVERILKQQGVEQDRKYSDVLEKL
jgi:hypothetical protein